MEANFADPAIRENAAQLIEAAKEEEVQAIQALQAALDDLAATQPKPEAPPGTGEELCRTARELKAQGRLTEAAAELAKAIAADPKCVEAYWVLAWVRAELKDVAGAAEAFHKVIELAPNSERAEEARQAVERLGR